MFQLTPIESQLLLVLLTQPLSKVKFEEIKQRLTKTILYRLEKELPIQNPFSLTKVEFQTLFDFLDFEKIPTNKEKKICLDDLSDVPGRWWEQYGYPGIHIFDKFCLCSLCLYFYYKAPRELRNSSSPGLVINVEEGDKFYEPGEYRVNALGKLEKAKIKKRRLRKRRKK